MTGSGDAPLDLQAVLVHRGQSSLAAYGRPDARDGVHDLAEAIATSPAWRHVVDGVVAFRARPEPAVALVGRFDAAQLAWIEGLRAILTSVLPWARRLDATAVEEACISLAGSLRTELSPDELARATFVGVPRGGVIVLGMLSYLLDLAPGQVRVGPALAGETELTGLVVLVDDVVISGLRAGDAVASVPAQASLVLTTLASHPGARKALRQAHPRLRAVLSALDLHDHAADVHGDGAGAWRARWRDRAPKGAVWVGAPEHVVFPWGEPDIATWNEVLGRAESAWHLFPPHATLKARGRLSAMDEPLESRIEETVASEGPYQPSDRLLYAHVDEGVLLIDIESAASYFLDGTAATIWTALLDGGPGADPVGVAARRLTDSFEVPARQARSDVQAFRDELLGAGFLCRADT